MNSPLVVLLRKQYFSANKLLKQQANVLSSDGAALQRGLHTVPYKHEQQRNTV